jgi:hypothetical protein
MNTIDAYAEPQPRTVRLPAALAVGAVLGTGAFGGGYVLAQSTDDPVVASVAAPRAAAHHTFGDALTESFAVKHRSAVGGKAADIRQRRIR